VTDYETCTRCGRKVDIDSDEHTYGEADEDGGYICEGCLTPGEQAAIAEDAAALDAAGKAAGLSGEHVDSESMDDTEYEMREELAQIIYEQDQR